MSMNFVPADSLETLPRWYEPYCLRGLAILELVMLNDRIVIWDRALDLVVLLLCSQADVSRHVWGACLSKQA
jgi:hypothetical protein